MFNLKWIRLPLLSLSIALAGCHSLSLLPDGSTGPGATADTRPAPKLRCPDGATTDDLAVARSINVPPERLAALKSSRSLTNHDICTMPDAALKRAFSRLDKPKADHPGDWADFRNLQRRSEDGRVKPDGLVNGIMHRKEMLRKQHAKKSAAGQTAVPGATAAEGTTAIEGASFATGEVGAQAAGISAAQWNSLGPGNIGGRIRAVLIDPTATDSIWVGSVSGGIWHSTDAGASWSPVNDFMGNLSVSSLVMDPNDPKVIYAGTGEGFYNGDAVRGAGIFKSTDGGVTWNQLPATVPSSNTNSDAYSWYYVNRLAISADGSTILAATRGAYSNTGCIYRSTDGGTTWTAYYSGAAVWDVRFDPNDPAKAVAGATSYNSGLGQNATYLLRSVDGGRTWSYSTSIGKFRTELAYAKSNSQIVYASQDYNSGQILKSQDGGASWSPVSTPQHLGNQGWYDNTIWVDPTNASHLVIGGLDLWRSTNGGVSWTRISNWVNNMYNGYPNVPHADHHALVSDPNYNGTTNRRLYNANDGGIFRAADLSIAGESSGWESLNQGLAITQFYSGAGHSAAGGRIVGGTQDNGSLLRSGTGNNWQLAYGGDGGYSAVDSQNDNYFYGEYVYLQLHRATNGATSSSIYSGISDAGQSSSANFIAPFVLDPNDNNRMLAGGASLWQSLAVKAFNPPWGSIKGSVGSNISAIAVAEGNSSTVWVGHNNGKVYLSTNSLVASPTWTQVGAGTLPARMVTRILIDKDSPSRVYVAFGGYNANNLYRTTDNGATWTNITGALPAVPIFSMVRHRSNPDCLYVGTEVGMFSSQDGGSTWYTTNDGPATVEISELSWLDDTTLLAATHGRGMFRATVSLPPDSTPPTVTAVTPANGATDTAINGSIAATFSEPMASGSITQANFTLDHGATGSVSYDPATRTATFTPSANLAYSTTYTATIGTAAQDLAGNPLAAPKTWSFSTMAPPSLSQGFGTGTLPTGWTVVDNAGTGKVWSFNNPTGLSNFTGGSGSFAIADSGYGGQASMNTELRSPVYNLSNYSSVALSFKTAFVYGGETADVDVSVNGAAGPWTNVWRKTANYYGPKSELLNLSFLAAGKANVMFRFHYYNTNNVWYWQVDDVALSGTQFVPARLLSPAVTEYQAIQPAYDSAASGNTIQARAMSFSENLLFGGDIAVYLKGGFDDAYTSNSGGSSVLTGMLRVKNGTVKLENLRFR